MYTVMLNYGIYYYEDQLDDSSSCFRDPDLLVNKKLLWSVS